MGTEDTLSPLEGESGDTPKKAVKKPKAEAGGTIRRHKVENVNRNQLAQVLDAYSAENRIVIALNPSRDIGGTYEVVSYKNERVN